MVRRIWQLAVVLALGASASCGYSLAGRGSFLPPHIRVIAVPTFTNATSVYDIERRITDRVRSELIGRGRYKVETSTAGADAVIAGEISSITINVAAVNQQGQATRYQLLLTSKVEFRDLKSGKVVWSNPALQFRDNLDTAGGVTDPVAFFGQEATALDRLATEFARTLVSAILEAF